MGSGQSKDQKNINIGGATTNGGIYDRGDCPEGFYEGDWREHKWHGQGTLTWKSGSVYTGEWKEGKRHGHGKMIWSSGASYVGGFKENKRFGNGLYIYVNGNKYDGGFKDDTFHGIGKYTYYKGHVYEGGYNMGHQCGKGKIVYRSGTIFEGQLKDSKLQFGVIKIGINEYVAEFDVASNNSEGTDVISLIYNVRLSSHTGQRFKPLQFSEGNFLDTAPPPPSEETKDQKHIEELEVPPALEEELKKKKAVHERPPPFSPEPVKRHLEIDELEDMEDEMY